MVDYAKTKEEDERKDREGKKRKTKTYYAPGTVLGSIHNNPIRPYVMSKPNVRKVN